MCNVHLFGVMTPRLTLDLALTIESNLFCILLLI